MIITVLFKCFDETAIFTSSGIVVGKTVKVQNNYVHEYLGIPYAKPPVGKLRFKHPQPAPFCFCILDTSRKSPSCVQKYINPLVFINDTMSEDCLYLNVWVPVCEMEEKPFTTMIWIHGGGFVTGSGNEERSDGGVIASLGCVIVVSFNYRLDAFGFLNLGNDEAPGNMGMMDQVLALQWVNKNIANFGGHSSKITIFGVSSGGVSVANHLVSPLTKGLFNRAIIGSLSKLSDNKIFTAVNPSHNINISKIIVSRLGCDRNTFQETMACMHLLSQHTIPSVTKSLLESVPTVFGLLPELGEPYLPNDDKVDVHDVDAIIGNAKDEGSFLLRIYHPEFEFEENPKLNKSEAKRIIASYYDLCGKKLDSIFEEYLGSLTEEYSTTTVKRTYKALGDGSYTCPSYFLTRGLSNKHNVYYYTFSHRRLICGPKKWLGATHGEDIYFIFGLPFRKPECYTSEEADLSLKVIQLLTSFAKTGKPSYASMKEPWLPFDGDGNSIVFQLANISTRKNPLEQTCKVWRKIYQNNKFFV